MAKKAPEYLLFHCPQMRSLARKITKANPAFVRGDCQWRLFPDRFPNINFGKHPLFKRGEVVFLASFDSPADAFVQICAIYTLARLSGSLTVVLPFFATGFMERFGVGNEGQLVTAKTTAMMLSATPSCLRGPVRFIIYDIHALQLFNYFDGVVVRLKTGLKYLAPLLAQLEKVSICFPDEGARKRFEGMPDKYGLERLPIIECRKRRRTSGNHAVKIGSGRVRGRHVVIIDDAILGGGTMLSCKDALVSAGAAKVSVFVTHGRFACCSWKRFLRAGFHKIWITDSCPKTASIVAKKRPFEVISLAGSIIRAIAE